MDYHVNIGWFDIDVDFLKVVDKPAPRNEAGQKIPRSRRPAAGLSGRVEPQAVPAKPARGKTIRLHPGRRPRRETPAKPDAGVPASQASAAAKPVPKPAAGKVDRSKDERSPT